MIIAAISLGILVVAFAAIFNNLAGKRNKVRNSWRQIDMQLKRRFDLIPDLVETLKLYSAHGRSTFEQVTSARSGYMSAATPDELMKANGELTQVLGRLFAVMEAYPELKANENFVTLQQELSGTEDKIDFARQIYNDAVIEYNNAVRMFPSSFVASLAGFREEPFFSAGTNKRSAPGIKF